VNLTASVTIGKGGTYSCGSDRYPVTVIAKTDRTITVQNDNFTATRAHNYFGTQDYDFTPNPNGATMVCRWSTKRGSWISKGTRVHIGMRGAYRDPSF
jgi:hypothetical protein